MIILHKVGRQANTLKMLLVKGFHKKPAFVPEHARFNNHHTRQGCFSYFYHWLLTLALKKVILMYLRL